MSPERTLTARPPARRPTADPEYAAAVADLRRIPGVGASIADDLWRLGVRRVEELRERDPEELYGRFCALSGGPVDRCLLYVFRCAVYFARTPDPDPELLKWWSWKDGGGRGRALERPGGGKLVSQPARRQPGRGQRRERGTPVARAQRPSPEARP